MEKNKCVYCGLIDDCIYECGHCKKLTCEDCDENRNLSIYENEDCFSEWFSEGFLGGQLTCHECYNKALETIESLRATNVDTDDINIYEANNIEQK